MVNKSKIEEIVDSLLIVLILMLIASVVLPFIIDSSSESIIFFAFAFALLGKFIFVPLLILKIILKLMRHYKEKSITCDSSSVEQKNNTYKKLEMTIKHEIYFLILSFLATGIFELKTSIIRETISVFGLIVIGVVQFFIYLFLNSDLINIQEKKQKFPSGIKNIIFIILNIIVGFFMLMYIGINNSFLSVGIGGLFYLIGNIGFICYSIKLLLLKNVFKNTINK